MTVKRSTEGDYLRAIISLGCTWRIQQKINVSTFLLGNIWPCWSWTKWNSTKHLVSSNPLYNHQAGRIFISTHPLPSCNSRDTLVRKLMTAMLYTLIPVVYVLFCYFYVKRLVMKSISLSPSLGVFRLFLLWKIVSYSCSRANVIFLVLIYTHRIFVDN